MRLHGAPLPQTEHLALESELLTLCVQTEIM